MSQSTDVFTFKEETNQLPTKSSTIWKILSIEDDNAYQQALVNSLQLIELPADTKLTILTAASAYDASVILNTHQDIGLILLDVVMEEDDSGLQLVNMIRQDIGNLRVRIVLITGQPSFAPEKEVMRDLDIDEYWNKADINLEKLHSIVLSNLRTWHYVSQIADARQGLKIVLDAAKLINSRYDLPSFTRTVLSEIGRIIGVEKGGIFCMGNLQDAIEDSRVITATGCFAQLEGYSIFDQQLHELHPTIKQAIKEARHILGPTQSVFYFDTNEIDAKRYIIVVNSETALNDEHINLLQVFSENISSGFTNIALLNRVTDLAYSHIDLKIPNRNWLKKEIQSMQIRERQLTRLLMLEIKYFDEMKFTFGHEFVQNVLTYIYQTLNQILPPSSRIALSGHKQFSILLDAEFAIGPELISRLTYNEIDVEGVAHASSFTLLDMQLGAIRETSAEEIISMAESVLKEATHNNATYVQHSQKSVDTIARRYALMGELRKAIRERKLQIMLQPKVSLTDGTVVGFEALARWQRDDDTFVSPDEFIAIAETSGLIHKLDCLIFEKTLEALGRLVELGYRLPIAFNASSYDLLHNDYFKFVTTLLKNSALPTELLEIEVTETHAISDYERIKLSLNRFIALGLKVSIDDFGTGYSSLAHISNLNAHCIKIDRSFISKLESDKNSEHVINMILNLGKQFKFNVVAEGIENEYQKQWLSKMGCHVGQGYLFAKPMFLHDIIDWLSQQSVN